MKFSIYYANAGFGLAKDALVLQGALQKLGHLADIHELPRQDKSLLCALQKYLIQLFKLFGFLFLYRRMQRLILGKPKDVCVHLEKIFYWKLFNHQRHILIPNQEWFNPSQFVLLSYIDKVWAKTRFAQNIFSEFKSTVRYIGFYSNISSQCSDTLPEQHFFSRIGISPLRGAQQLVDAWRLHPEWPLLKMVIDKSIQPPNPPHNVEYIDSFSQYEDYLSCAKGALFHIYASEMEGFGHSIVEAMSYGAVMLVTDAPPMNEIVSLDCALLIPASYSGQKFFSPRFLVTASGIELAVERALSLSAEQIGDLSVSARLRLEMLERNFYSNLALAIEEFEI